MNMYKESTTWTPAPVINPTHIRVDENVFTDQYRAYGEDDSIYITVGLGDVDTNNESSITKINGVVTGVQNINIQIGKGEKTEAYKYVPQIYTVYDKNNYIIASIVIGKAVGAVDNIAYILGEVDSEGITEDGSYLYTFDAIVNGKIQSVTAKGDYKGAFDNTIINSGNGVRLFYDADGYVTSIEKLTKDEIHDLTETENSNEIKDEDVYWIGIQSDRTIHLQGRTLYLTDNQNDTGLTINTASAIVRQYDENLDRATTVEYDSVAEAFENLKDNASELDGKQFKGTIYAALDSNGIASWIIFDAEKTDTPISFS